MSIDTGTIYDQLLKLQIDLDFGDIPTPAYLQAKILECSNNTRSVEKRMIEATREFSSKEKSLKLEQVRLEIKKRDLLVNDPVIKKLPTGKEREAAADRMLEKEHDTVVAFENDVMELQNLLSSIRLVHQNLRTTNSDIRVLMRIMEQQIFKLNVGTKTDKEVSGLLASLGEVERLEEEITPDDVESSTQSIEPDEPDGRSEGATQKKDTALDEAGSEDGEGLGVSSFLTEEPEEAGVAEDAPAADGDGEGPAQSAVGSAAANASDGSQRRTEAAGDGGGGPVVGGLDIDLGEILGEPQKAPAAQPSPKAEPAGGKAADTGAKPKSDGPPQGKVPKEAELDIDDILASLS